MAGADEEIDRIGRECGSRNQVCACIGSCDLLDVDTGWCWTMMACWEKLV